MKKIVKIRSVLYSLAFFLMNVLGCGDIPENQQGCAINGDSPECYVFKKPVGKTCEETSGPNSVIDYKIVDIREVGPCYVDL